MNKKELLELIRDEQNKIENIRDSLNDRLDSLIEIKKTVILSMPDDSTVDDKWVDDQEAREDIIRNTSAIKETI